MLLGTEEIPLIVQNKTQIICNLHKYWLNMSHVYCREANQLQGCNVVYFFVE